MSLWPHFFLKSFPIFKSWVTKSCLDRCTNWIFICWDTFSLLLLQFSVWSKVLQCVATRELKVTVLKVKICSTPFILITLCHASYKKNPSPLAVWPVGAAQHVFKPQSEASNFFKRRSRRSSQYRAELQGTFALCWSHLTAGKPAGSGTGFGSAIYLVSDHSRHRSSEMLGLLPVGL